MRRVLVLNEIICSFLKFSKIIYLKMKCIFFTNLFNNAENITLNCPAFLTEWYLNTFIHPTFCNYILWMREDGDARAAVTCQTRLRKSEHVCCTPTVSPAGPRHLNWSMTTPVRARVPERINCKGRMLRITQYVIGPTIPCRASNENRALVTSDICCRKLEWNCEGGEHLCSVFS